MKFILSLLISVLSVLFLSSTQLVAAVVDSYDIQFITSSSYLSELFTITIDHDNPIPASIDLPINIASMIIIGPSNGCDMIIAADNSITCNYVDNHYNCVNLDQVTFALDDVIEFTKSGSDCQDSHFNLQATIIEALSPSYAYFIEYDTNVMINNSQDVINEQIVVINDELLALRLNSQPSLPCSEIRLYDNSNNFISCPQILNSYRCNGIDQSFQRYGDLLLYGYAQDCSTVHFQLTIDRPEQPNEFSYSYRTDVKTSIPVIVESETIITVPYDTLDILLSALIPFECSNHGMMLFDSNEASIECNINADDVYQCSNIILNLSGNSFTLKGYESDCTTVQFSMTMTIAAEPTYMFTYGNEVGPIESIPVLDGASVTVAYDSIHFAFTASQLFGCADNAMILTDSESGSVSCPFVDDHYECQNFAANNLVGPLSLTAFKDDCSTIEFTMTIMIADRPAYSYVYVNDVAASSSMTVLDGDSITVAYDTLDIIFTATEPFACPAMSMTDAVESTPLVCSLVNGQYECQDIPSSLDISSELMLTGYKADCSTIEFAMTIVVAAEPTYTYSIATDADIDFPDVAVVNGASVNLPYDTLDISLKSSEASQCTSDAVVLQDAAGASMVCTFDNVDSYNCANVPESLSIAGSLTIFFYKSDCTTVQFSMTMTIAAEPTYMFTYGNEVGPIESIPVLDGASVTVAYDSIHFAFTASQLFGCADNAMILTDSESSINCLVNADGEYECMNFPSSLSITENLILTGFKSDCSTIEFTMTIMIADRPTYLFSYATADETFESVAVLDGNSITVPYSTIDLFLTSSEPFGCPPSIKLTDEIPSIMTCPLVDGQYECIDLPSYLSVPDAVVLLNAYKSDCTTIELTITVIFERPPVICDMIIETPTSTTPSKKVVDGFSYRIPFYSEIIFITAEEEFECSSMTVIDNDGTSVSCPMTDPLVYTCDLSSLNAISDLHLVSYEADCETPYFSIDLDRPTVISLEMEWNYVNLLDKVIVDGGIRGNNEIVHSYDYTVDDGITTYTIPTDARSFTTTSFSYSWTICSVVFTSDLIEGIEHECIVSTSIDSITTITCPVDNRNENGYLIITGADGDVSLCSKKDFISVQVISFVYDDKDQRQSVAGINDIDSSPFSYYTIKAIHSSAADISVAAVTVQPATAISSSVKMSIKMNKASSIIISSNYQNYKNNDNINTMNSYTNWLYQLCSVEIINNDNNQLITSCAIDNYQTATCNDLSSLMIGQSNIVINAVSFDSYCNDNNAINYSTSIPLIVNDALPCHRQ